MNSPREVIFSPRGFEKTWSLASRARTAGRPAPGMHEQRTLLTTCCINYACNRLMTDMACTPCDLMHKTSCSSERSVGIFSGLCGFAPSPRSAPRGRAARRSIANWPPPSGAGTPISRSTRARIRPRPRWPMRRRGLPPEVYALFTPACGAGAPSLTKLGDGACSPRPTCPDHHAS